MKSACGYIEGDKTALIDIVEVLLLSTKEKWEKVAFCFNT
jgi:hypothetical protein